MGELVDQLAASIGEIMPLIGAAFGVVIGLTALIAIGAFLINYLKDFR